MSEHADDLAAALRPAFADPDPARRAVVLRQTVGALRRRVLFGRVKVLVAAVLLFVAGGVTGWLAKPSALPVVVNVPTDQSAQPTVQPTLSDPQPLTAEQLELQAELADDPADAACLFRKAGDRFLSDRDYENAARCYRRHLNAADADGRTASAEDSWMLHAMKVPK